MVQKTAYPAKEITSYMDQLKAKHGLPTEPLTDEELAALAKSKGLDKGAPSIKAKLTAVNNDGREIEFPFNGGSQKLDVSNSRTKVTIAGQKAARGDLKAGMECAIEYMDGQPEANGITCQ